MDSLEHIRATLAASLPDVRERYHVDRLSLFGSWVRGQQKDESDVDILVDFQPGARVGLLACIALEQELSASLGRKVDLVTRGALRPRIGEQVLAELVAV